VTIKTFVHMAISVCSFQMSEPNNEENKIYNADICFAIIRIQTITVLSAISWFTLTLITISGYGTFPAILIKHDYNLRFCSFEYCARFGFSTFRQTI
jgi:hypothetical protein